MTQISLPTESTGHRVAPLVASADFRHRLTAVIAGSLANLVAWYAFYLYPVFTLYLSGALFPAGDARLPDVAGIFAVGFVMQSDRQLAPRQLRGSARPRQGHGDVGDADVRRMLGHWNLSDIRANWRTGAHRVSCGCAPAGCFARWLIWQQRRLSERGRDLEPPRVLPFVHFCHVTFSAVRGWRNRRSPCRCRGCCTRPRSKTPPAAHPGPSWSRRSSARSWSRY